EQPGGTRSAFSSLLREESRGPARHGERLPELHSRGLRSLGEPITNAGRHVPHERIHRLVVEESNSSPVGRIRLDTRVVVVCWICCGALAMPHIEAEVEQKATRRHRRRVKGVNRIGPKFELKPPDTLGPELVVLTDLEILELPERLVNTTAGSSI